MKIFFQASPRGLVQYSEHITKTYRYIEKLGHTHLNDFIISKEAVKFYTYDEIQLQEIYQEVISEMKKADLVILDISIHSLTMGFYVKAALDFDKPTIILHAKNQKPRFFSGIQNDLLQILEYTPETIPETLEDAINFAKDKINIRFNMFLSPELNNYLKWAAIRTGTQRSSFFRSLLLEHKEKHEEEYQASLKV